MRRRGKLTAASLALCAAACTADTFVGVPDAATDSAGQGAVAIACGTAACQPTEICCVSSSSTSVAYACQTTCSAPASGARLSELQCTSTADCAGQLCCIHRDSSGVNVSACEAACNPSNNEVQLCDPAAADPGCPPTAPCSTNLIADWSLPPSFATCGGLGVP
ncbi:MAG TPA: hypothetical protein VLM85_01175 [Polyangiaceae bacterium]|nr:hypothetical protein [Polyangiaceae bacterium]